MPDRVLPDAVVDAVIEHPDTYTRSFFARNPHVDPAQRVRLIDDPEWFVRAHLADGPRIPFQAVDPDPKVRLAVSVHPALSEEERATIDYEVPTDRGFHPPAPSVPREPEDVRRDALSAHPMLRRKAARVHELAPDLVARMADHEDPEARALAVRDPETAPAVVERLTRDPDPAGRAEAARHPNLPRPRLTERLDDEELAHPAAANPALDVAEIGRPARTPGDPAGPSVDTLI
ncbi:hypothetical protein ACFXGR_27255 [Streptomyces mirabilis]|uniref:hypothetical protein n=1 Tax=Streptomyces mirabilis TaxID=68239 RepID=UPI0036B018E0